MDGLRWENKQKPYFMLGRACWTCCSPPLSFRRLANWSVFVGLPPCPIQCFYIAIARIIFFISYFRLFYVCKVNCWWKVLLHNFFNTTTLYARSNAKKQQNEGNHERPLHNNSAWYFSDSNSLHVKSTSILLFVRFCCNKNFSLLSNRILPFSISLVARSNIIFHPSAFSNWNSIMEKWCN